MPIRQLSKELQRVAKRELNELPNRVQADIAHIREWISQQPHLRARTDDQWLLAFLRAEKFNLQRTKDHIDLFYTARNLDPEFWNRDPFLPDIQEVLNQVAVAVALPHTSLGAVPRVILNRWGNLVPNEKSLIANFKVIQMITNILMLEDDNFVVAGATLIWDLNNFSNDYMSQLKPDFWKHLILLNQDVYPMRIKKAVFVNAPSSLVALYDIFKIFSAEYIKTKVIFYEDDGLKNINDIVPESLLPKDYGGDQASCREIAERRKYSNYTHNLKAFHVQNGKKQINAEKVGSMFSEGVIEPNTSSYSSPVVLVEKNNGKPRFCVDYRGLYQLTVSEVVKPEELATQV